MIGWFELGADALASFTLFTKDSLLFLLFTRKLKWMLFDTLWGHWSLCLLFDILIKIGQRLWKSWCLFKYWHIIIVSIDSVITLLMFSFSRFRSKLIIIIPRKWRGNLFPLLRIWRWSFKLTGIEIRLWSLVFGFRWSFLRRFTKWCFSLFLLNESQDGRLPWLWVDH